MSVAVDVLLSLAVIACAVLIGVLVHRIRTDRVSAAAAAIVTGVCGVGLIVMVLTDWPVESMSRFWADHSVLGGLLSTLLLVGLVFMVYERAEQKHQDDLAVGLSGAGAGGLVDHLVDIEVALALLTTPERPEQLVPMWGDWDAPGKPLRWLRRSRHVLDGGEHDPRSSPSTLTVGVAAERTELVDQSIRRLLSGMRDWAPLVAASSKGTAALLVLSGVRADLMALHTRLSHGSADDREPLESTIGDLRLRLRILALCFEEWSGAPGHRVEILTTHEPLGRSRPDFGRTSHTLTHDIDAACDVLGLTRR